MRNRLLVFSGFAHDSQRILAAVHRLALVGIERGKDRSQPIVFELGIAPFTDADERRGVFHDSHLALRHGYSLAPNACANETAPVPESRNDISHAIPKNTNQPLFVAETQKLPFHSAIPNTAASSKIYLQLKS
jgi:hypothetical protein